MLNILRVTVLTRNNGADIILLLLDLPEGCYPFVGNATAEIKVAKGTGEEYVRNNFGIVPDKVILID